MIIDGIQNGIKILVENYINGKIHKNNLINKIKFLVELNNLCNMIDHESRDLSMLPIKDKNNLFIKTLENLEYFIQSEKF